MFPALTTVELKGVVRATVFKAKAFVVQAVGPGQKVGWPWRNVGFEGLRHEGGLRRKFRRRFHVEH